MKAKTRDRLESVTRPPLARARSVESFVPLMTSRSLAGTFLRGLNLPMLLHSIVFGMGTTGCAPHPTAPSGISDEAATSCTAGGPGTILHSPAPEFRQIIPSPILINAGSSATLRVCFFRDKEKPDVAAATQWTSANPGIASVSPAVGATTVLTGRAFGSTALTAIINGAAETTLVAVCEPGGRCPF